MCLCRENKGQRESRGSTPQASSARYCHCDSWRVAFLIPATSVEALELRSSHGLSPLKSALIALLGLSFGRRPSMAANQPSRDIKSLELSTISEVRCTIRNT